MIWVKGRDSKHYITIKHSHLVILKKIKIKIHFSYQPTQTSISTATKLGNHCNYLFIFKNQQTHRHPMQFTNCHQTQFTNANHKPIHRHPQPMTHCTPICKPMPSPHYWSQIPNRAATILSDVLSLAQCWAPSPPLLTQKNFYVSLIGWEGEREGERTKYERKRFTCDTMAMYF